MTIEGSIGTGEGHEVGDEGQVTGVEGDPVRLEHIRHFLCIGRRDRFSFRFIPLGDSLSMYSDLDDDFGGRFYPVVSSHDVDVVAVEAVEVEQCPVLSHRL